MSAEIGPRGPGSSEGRAHRVGELLPGVVRKLGLEQEVARQGALERWATVVGRPIAAVTEAASASRGVLFVRVASSAWLTELNMMRHDILSRLNAGQKEGRIERIVFTLSEDANRFPGRDRPMPPGPG